MRILLAFLLMLVPALAEVRMDVEYAHRGDLSLKLDAHVPEGKGPFPAVILVHGGGWEEGEKAGIFVAPLLPVLDRSGLAWFTIDYRLAPKYTYPAPVEDVQDAIRWVKKHAKEYRVDPNRIVLMGESAGGHLVALVAARPTPDTHVAAVVPFYTPTDLNGVIDDIPDAHKLMRQLFGVENFDESARRRLKEASPITYVRRGLPPFLMVCGTEDKILYKQSTKMCDQLKAAGNACDFYTVDGGIHGVMNWEKVPTQQGYKDYLIAWLRKTTHMP